MIESGFNPVAVSRAGAAGLWQFMASTARRYGLRVDQWVDERFDPEKSTFAAASYLRDLYRQFGSWQLAQAAYNAGELSVTRAIQATGTSDFWALSRSRFLPRETKEFVPQIAAATLIGRNPFEYGFEGFETTVTSFETVSVPPSTDLRWLAAITGISLDVLRAMNPSLVRAVTPPGAPHTLKVPLGNGPAVLAAIDAPRPKSLVAGAPARRPARVTPAGRKPPPLVAAAPQSDVRVSRAAGTSSTTPVRDVHVVRPRDTVSAIARHYGVSIDNVLRWNELENAHRIRPGDRLRVTERTLSGDRPLGAR
jgi:membrane-bound lytic murein transglycosylase D